MKFLSTEYLTLLTPNISLPATSFTYSSSSYRNIQVFVVLTYLLFPFCSPPFHCSSIFIYLSFFHFIFLLFSLYFHFVLRSLYYKILAFSNYDAIICTSSVLSSLVFSSLRDSFNFSQQLTDIILFKVSEYEKLLLLYFLYYFNFFLFTNLRYLSVTNINVDKYNIIHITI